MRILVFLPGPSFQLFAAALGRHAQIDRVVDAARLVAVLREQMHDLVVIDPVSMRDSFFEDLIPHLERSPVACLMYCELKRETVNRILSAAKAGISELVIRGLEDSPALLRTRVLRSLQGTARALFARQLESNFAILPARLSTQIVAAVYGAEAPSDVTTLARSAGIKRRSLDRWMTRARLRSASSVLVSIRLLRFWEVLCEGDLNAAQSRRFEYGDFSRAIKERFRRVTGVLPRDADESLSRDNFVHRLVESLSAD